MLTCNLILILKKPTQISMMFESGWIILKTIEKATSKVTTIQIV